MSYRHNFLVSYNLRKTPDLGVILANRSQYLKQAYIVSLAMLLLSFSH